MKGADMKLYLVNSDNLDNAILTAEAYAEFRLQMSTGDFHTHTATVIDAPTDDQICDAMYWDETEQAFMSGAFDEPNEGG
jgi:hypothetical protein